MFLLVVTVQLSFVIKALIAAVTTIVIGHLLASCFRFVALKPLLEDNDAGVSKSSIDSTNALQGRSNIHR
jgi:hypothetical protein